MRIHLRRYPGTDILIHESTMASCLLAWRLAQQGRRVTLVTGATSPLVEMVAAMRPWLTESTLHQVPTPFRRLVEAATKQVTTSGRRLLHVGKLVVSVEDLLLDAGVRVLYNARPAALLARDRTVTDIVYGGKFGLVAIPTRMAIDASHNALLARLAGGTFDPTGPADAPQQLIYCLLCSQSAAEPLVYPLVDPEATGTVRHDGDFAEYHLTFPPRGDAADETGHMARRLVAIQRIVCRSLLRDESPIPIHPFMGPDIAVRIPDQRLTGQRDAVVGRLKVQTFDNVLAAGPCTACDEVSAESFVTDPATACGWMQRWLPAILDAAGDCLAHPEPQGPRRVVGIGDGTGGETIAGELGCTDPAFDEPGTSAIELDLPDLPVIAEADVVVTGGGTSGFPAAVTAAGQGLRVVCTEHHGAFGGANTIGGVSKLWFGYWNPCFQRYYLRVRRASRGVELPTSMAYLAASPPERLDLLAGTPACGVLHERGQVKGVCVLTEHGMGIVRGKHFIDATGDGDLAAWAGNPYTWGSERDEITLWYSFGRFHHRNNEASRNYSSVVDTRSLNDTSRAVIVGRRQIGVLGEAEYPQYYLAVRETRHITGRARVSYLDMLMNRHYDDAVMVCLSNIDIKGMHSSDAVMAGFIERSYLRTYRCTIPYRAFLPVALDNLFVAGKAYSISHDAVSMARMQPDMMSLGLVAGFAVSVAHTSQRPLADLDVQTLQRLLIDQGVITQADATATFERLPPTGEQLQAMAEHAGMSPTEMNTQAQLLAAGPEAAQALARVVDDVPGYMGTAVARILCLLQHPAGARHLHHRLEHLLKQSNGSLPAVNSDGNHVMPDHGWAPEPVQLINALALLGDAALLPTLAQLVGRLDIDPQKSDSRFLYAHCVAYALERLAVPEGADMLASLLNQPALSSPVIPRDADPRRCANDVKERLDYLSLCLARAAARCGAQEGYRRLIASLDDQRLHLARSSRRELVDLTHEDHGFDQQRWADWLKAHANNLTPQPYTRRHD